MWDIASHLAKRSDEKKDNRMCVTMDSLWWVGNRRGFWIFCSLACLNLSIRQISQLRFHRNVSFSSIFLPSFWPFLGAVSRFTFFCVFCSMCANRGMKKKKKKNILFLCVRDFFHFLCVWCDKPSLVQRHVQASSKLLLSLRPLYTAIHRKLDFTCWEKEREEEGILYSFCFDLLAPIWERGKKNGLSARNQKWRNTLQKKKTPKPNPKKKEDEDDEE